MPKEIKLDKGDFLGYTHLAKAWYKEYCMKGVDYVDEVMFGILCREGGCIAEVAMRWYKIESKVAPRLEMFDDTFKLFDSMPEVFTSLSSLPNNFTPEQFIEYLTTEFGFEDNTSTTR